uniref:Uncharacterized protein n=1 Tax=Meloidogyne enterolobii TaxID=390850 RepID=A0A6V7VKQ5_MELEN|nr:unnamed protein product [Meloidogyne enterolobii]
MFLKLILKIFALLIFYNCIECSDSGHSTAQKIQEESNHLPKHLQIVKGEGVKQREKILYICDNTFFSHIQFNEVLANILAKTSTVDMLVYSNKYKPMPKGNFNIINIPVDEKYYNKSKPGAEMDDYRRNRKYRYLGIYEGILC